MIAPIKIHNDIVNKWKGSRVRENVSLGYQCVAWVKKYYEEQKIYLGSFGGGAINGWNKGFSGFNKVINTTFAIPKVGSMVFFAPSKANGWYGHVAVVGRANLFWMEIVEQNGGRGSGDGLRDDAIRMRRSTYSNCLGWYESI